MRTVSRGHWVDGRAFASRGRLPRGYAYGLILPAALLVLGFTLYPYGYAVWGSLHSLSPILPLRYIGLTNYRLVLSSSYFVRALSNTGVFILATVPIILMLGVAVAALLNRRFPGDVVVRTAVLLPWAVPTVISGVVWRGMFADTWGAVNAVLYRMGVISDYLEWLTTPALAFVGIVVAQVWTQFPLATVLILAAMQSIPDELYEAAALDGASPHRCFATVTLPLIKPMLIVVALFEILVGISTFDITYGLTGGGPGTATTLIGYFMWAESFKMLSFGKGSALAVLLAVFALVVIVPLMRAMPRGALTEE